MPDKKLGFGLMRLPLLNPDDKGSIDLDTTIKMVDIFMERGFTYYDTAYPYHDGQSERTFRKAVVERYPRQSFTVTDKMPCWNVNEASDMDRIFNEQLDRCGVTYFDYYWLHALNKNYYAIMQRVNGFDFIMRKKAEGKIRHIGFSFHDDPALLEQILTEHPEAEIVQLQINYLDWDDPKICSRECYEICRRHGKPIVVMEPVKGGALASVPDLAKTMLDNLNPEMSAASWAVRYAASLPGVMMVLSGMSNIEQVTDNTAYMQHFTPLSDSEQAAIGAVAGIIKENVAVPCTACHYCTDGCPQGIAIPEYFAIFNTLKQRNDEMHRNEMAQYFAKLAETHAAPDECIECAQCEEHCPQHISIIEMLKTAAQLFNEAF